MSQKAQNAPQHAVVWTEIPVSDLDKAMDFYGAVFQCDLSKDDAGPNQIAMFPTADGMGVAGHLYPGTPAKEGSGPTVHFTVTDSLAQARERVRSAGGSAHDLEIAIPAGAFCYASDPDGNSLGLFKAA